jgi:site-specific recombinase XerD
MNLNQAIDEFLMYLDVEKNYSDNTIAGYALDLRSLSQCLNQNKRELTLETLSPATIRRYIRDQVVTYGIKPRTLHRRISCLKSIY